MRIAFISGMSGFPWGGSEVLWSQAALRLREAGHEVFASVKKWPATPAPVAALRARGVVVQERRWVQAARMGKISARLLRREAAVPGNGPAWDEIARFRPALACVSQGGIADGVEWMERCAAAGIPYVCIAQANSEHLWPDDAMAARLGAAYQGARRACFVSQANLRLFEAQAGVRLANAEVVRNPFQVPFDAPPPWPGNGPQWRLACVGRLEPKAKGQDLLLRVLAGEAWRSRPVTVSFYGTGPSEKTLRAWGAELGLGERVRFAGHVDGVAAIWAAHHALVLPSRFEGLPLAMVEAMLCNRTSIVTDVAGNAELLEDGRTGFIAEAATVRHIAEAMERAWEARMQWEAMGCAAGDAARAVLPRDPAAVFAGKLLETA